MRPAPKISGLIITKNEERNIAEALNSLAFCDEIILVDSYSTDDTVKIAGSTPGVAVLQHAFEDFTKQKNFALSCANYEWILFLDADERITEPLKKEILAELRKDNAKDAYFFSRLFFVGNRKIRFSGTQRDKNIRLFRKSKCIYTHTKKVHETLEVQGETGALKNKLLHYSFENYQNFKKKMLFYGDLKGRELAEKSHSYYAAVKYFKTLSRFIKVYIIGLGFLDGLEGLKIAYLQSLYVFQTYESLKLNQEK